jgi:hypothetical protein
VRWPNNWAVPMACTAATSPYLSVDADPHNTWNYLRGPRLNWAISPQSRGIIHLLDHVRPCEDPAMCNRIVQDGVEVKPGQKAKVLLKGPGGEFQLEFGDAVFAGAAKSESRGYWISREQAEPVVIPRVSRYGEKNKETGAQSWEDVPEGTAFEGLLLPQPPGKTYRLLKVMTKPATAAQAARWGNDRAPAIRT